MHQEKESLFYPCLTTLISGVFFEAVIEARLTLRGGIAWFLLNGDQMARRNNGAIEGGHFLFLKA